MTDNRTTKLREKLTERGVEYTTNDHMGVCETSWNGFTAMQLTPGAKLIMTVTPEQAIAATLGRPKAKAHPYGYESDTGAFDCTRCECGCINDISAAYCNDCGGEIEIDMYAEKEIYRIPRNSVFAEKHDDGSLEFGGKRYIAATLGSEREKRLEKLVRDMWREITTCPDYAVPPCMTDGICERVRNLGVEMGGDGDE